MILCDFWRDFLFPVLTFLGFGILGYLTKNLLPSYFSEKGRNLATKQDISEITELVESVKHDFTKETEILKANLLVLSSTQVGIIAEERNAIMEFSHNYFKWINILTDSSLSNTDTHSIKSLNKAKSKLSELYMNVRNSHSKLSLLVENNDLIVFSDKMIIKTIEGLSDNSISYILQAIRLLQEWNLKEKLSSIGDEEYKRFLDDHRHLHQTFCKEMIENYREIMPMHKTFHHKCREHIYKLVQKHEKELI
jgi:hypothetical protein